MIISHVFSSVATAIALLGGLSSAIELEDQIPLQTNTAGEYYNIISGRRYVQANGALQPLTLVSAPNRNTVWYLVEAGKSTGRYTLRSANGWHASVMDGAPYGPVGEDPNIATQWKLDVITSQIWTVNSPSNLFWAAHSNSDEIWLDKKNGSAGGGQGWQFRAVNGRLDDMSD